MSQIQTISKTLKPSNGVDVATGMTTPIDDQNSDWLYSMNIQTGAAFDVRLALLTGGIIQERVVQAVAGVAYKGVGVNVAGYTVGENIPSDDADVAADDFLILKESPELLNKVISSPATIVATNPILKKDYQRNILYADGSSQVNFDSTMNSIGSIDIFREMLKNASLRLVEIQITTDNDAQLLKNILVTQRRGTILPGLTEISLANYYVPGALQRKVIVNKTMYFDANTFFMLDIPKGTNTTLTWKFSHMLSGEKLLHDKTNYENIIQKLITKN